MNRRALLWGAPPLVVALLAWHRGLPAGVLPDAYAARPTTDHRPPVAVLGDSDSHGFGDRIAFPPGSPLRGGPYRPVTLQWTEALAQLRGDALDLGDRGVHGGRRRVVALMERFGFERRTPRKEDHAYNFAASGAHCRDLLEGPLRQVPRLLALMARDPDRWARGAVVVRIGIVDLGGASVLERFAREPGHPELRARVDACVGQVARAVEALRRAHPTVAIVLVGILDNADHPPQFHRWHDPDALRNIRAALDGFDRGLAALAAADPRTVFFDDRAWFRGRWGERGPDGAPAYRDADLGGALVVAHGQGDHPSHSVLADGHAGLVWNVLWAQSLSEVLAGLLPLEPIGDGEVRALLEGAFAAAGRIAAEVHPPGRSSSK